MIEHAGAKGRFSFVCFDRFGRLRWREEFNNLVLNQGKNLMLDTFFSGAAYTTTGPYLGLISSVGFTGIVAGDTALSHPGWVEAGGAHAPTYTGPRPTMLFSAAASGAKALSAFLTFAITGTGTIKGGFVVLGPGAIATIDDTGGSLWSAGLFVGGDNLCHAGDAVSVNYITSL